jgi:hypothetical protein
MIESSSAIKAPVMVTPVFMTRLKISYTTVCHEHTNREGGVELDKR